MKQAKESSFRFLCAAAKILPEFAAFAAAVAAIFFDVIVLRQRCSESCLVEWCQFAAILSSGLILLAAAVRDRENDAGLMLAAILFLDMAIREQDATLDCIFHGFWTIPVGILTVFALFYALSRLLLYVLKRIHFFLKLSAPKAPDHAIKRQKQQ